jgi:hypothetical protein
VLVALPPVIHQRHLFITLVRCGIVASISGSPSSDRLAARADIMVAWASFIRCSVRRLALGAAIVAARIGWTGASRMNALSDLSLSCHIPYLLYDGTIITCSGKPFNLISHTCEIRFGKNRPMPVCANVNRYPSSCLPRCRLLRTIRMWKWFKASIDGPRLLALAALAKSANGRSNDLFSRRYVMARYAQESDITLLELESLSLTNPLEHPCASSGPIMTSNLSEA